MSDAKSRTTTPTSHFNKVGEKAFAQVKVEERESLILGKVYSVMIPTTRYLSVIGLPWLEEYNAVVSFLCLLRTQPGYN